MEPEEGTRPLPRHRFVELPVFGTAFRRTGAVRADQIAELRTIAGIEADDSDSGVYSEPESESEPDTGVGSGPGGAPDQASPKSRIPALDGLRALAVAAVLLYHAGFSHARGGFLGVDVFFVLSGYLITGLLAREYLATGAVALRRFYQRRARRLLPALFVVLAGVCAYAVLVLPSEAAGFRGDATASVFYVTNWWFVAEGQSYFGGTGRPSLLLHLWSLAVEEQFYVVWPAFLLVALGRSRPGSAADAHAERAERLRALWRAVGWATLLAACSIGLTVLLYSPWRDPSRVYYGTDTRAFELLIGVLAALWQITREQPRPRSAAPEAGAQTAHTYRRIATESASFLALAGIVGAFTVVPASSPTLYPLGLVAVSVASAVLIRTLVAGTAVSDLLSRRFFVWLGERSYSLYLWHWPIFDVTRPGADVAWPPQTVFLVRIVVSVLFAELTYRFIETPIRYGALGRTTARAREAFERRELGLPLATAGSALAVVAAAAMLADTLIMTAAAHPADARAVAVDNRPAAALDGPHGAGPAGPQPVPHSATGAVGNAVPNYPTAMPPRPANPPRVALIGDSQGMTLYLNRPPDTAEYLRLFDDTTEGCDFLGGRISSGAGDRRDLDAECGGTVAKWAARITRDGADTALMMVGAWDLFDEKVNGAALPFGSAGWDAYFTGRLAQAVGALKGTGLRQLDLALLPCYRPVHTSGSGGGLWPERGDDSRVAHVNMLLAGYAHDPAHHVGAVYPPAQFCQDPAIAASRSYRWDGVHYYKPGARLYLRNAIPQLLEAKTS